MSITLNNFATIYSSRTITNAKSPPKNRLSQKINELNNLLGNKNTNYINRPKINTNKPELDFSARKYLANSPIKKKKKINDTNIMQREYESRRIIGNKFSYSNFNKLN
jgi:hypothetical protein